MAYLAVRLGVLTALAACACSGGQPPKAPEPVPVVVLRVDRVSVSATKPGTSEKWDGTSGFPGERSASDPDLEVHVSAGTGVTYASETAYDTADAPLRYQIAVPTAAIPSDGLRIEVVDADAGRTPELIGSIRLSRADLERALSTPTHLLVLREGALSRLEIAVSPYAPLEISGASMAAKEGFHNVGARELYAGEIVELQAEGAYTVGTWYDKPIGPMGYPSGSARGYNLDIEPFHSAPHACAVATVGVGHLQGVLVTPKQRFVSRVAGPLRLGVNDNDPSNNHGTLTFKGATRAPTPEEWLGQDATRTAG